MLTTTLVADKETPGTIRFMEPDVPAEGRPLSIYLRKEMVEGLFGSTAVELGVTSVKLTLDRA
jgi:hypothetical protein